MLSKQQRALIADFNTKNFKKPRFNNAILLFEAQARKTPKKIAIEFGKEKLTYKELNQEADILASFLSHVLNKNQQKIYILADRGINIIIAFLGVLRSGNILIPINPQSPAETTAALFKEIKPDFIIIQQKYFNLLKKLEKNLAGVKVLIIDRDSKINYPKAKFELLTLDNTSQFLGKAQAKKVFKAEEKYANIYFTSGSTGRPKAVLGTNFSLAFRVEPSSNKYLKSNFRVSQLSPVYIRLSLTTEILSPLCCGATVCIPRNENLLFSVIKLVKWLKVNHITVVKFSPNIFRYFVEEIKNANQLKYLRYVIISGIKLVNDKYLRIFFAKFKSHIKLINSYGVIEVSQGFDYELSRSDLKRKIIPIGKSVGAKAIVLNKEKEVLPPGQIGEIYIRSPYLTAGYYNNPELTKKVFVKNPFSRNPKDIIYRTGDLGRLSADGNIECLGRSDRQTTIKEFQVELGRIEPEILAHPKIEDCVVLAKKNKGGENYLVAYYIAAGRLDEGQLTIFLRSRLPDYMLPSYFIWFAKMPLNLNGKVDQLALAAINERKYYTDKSLKGFRNRMEKNLLNIWREVLDIEKIGISDNFFSLGGSSLKAVAINTKLTEQFNIAFPLTVIFQNPTIKRLAVFLENQLKKKTSKKALVIKKSGKKKYYLASRIQKEFWQITKRPNSTFLNQLHIIKFTGFLNIKILQKALREIAKRHEILRTNFLEINGEVFQVIKKKVQPTIKVVNLSQQKVRQNQLGKLMREICKPFDLEKDLLIRAKLVKTGQRDDILLLVSHNIVFGDISRQLLFDEWTELYNSYLEKRLSCLPSLPLQYKDYAEWEQSDKHSRERERQKNYWLKKLKGDLPLPLRFPPDKVSSSRRPTPISNREMFAIDNKEILEKIRKIYHQTKTTPFMFILALFDIFLFKVTAEKDLIIGTNVGLRNSSKFSKLIGPFFNNLALRNKLLPKQNFIDVLRAAKKTVLEALANREYTFSEFIEGKRIFKGIPRLNVFLDVPFKYDQTKKFKGIKFNLIKTSFEKMSFDLKLAIRELSLDRLSLEFVYNHNLFSRKKIKKLLQNFEEILKQVAHNPYIKIGALKITKK